MRRPQLSSAASAVSAAAAILSLPLLAQAVNLNCKDIVVDGQDYNLEKLGGPHSVHWIQEHPPSVSNFTFTVDICQSLKPLKGIDKNDQCPQGTRVCGTEYITNTADNTTLINQVVPIAGDYTLHRGKGLDPKFTRLKNSDSNSDKDKDGLRIELRGGKYPFNQKKGQEQKALIEFVCDESRTGLEGLDDPLDERETEDGDDEEKGDEGAEKRGLRVVRRAEGEDAPEGEEEEDGGDDGDDNGDDDDDDEEEKRSLRFKSYKDEGDIKTLRLEWRTKYACESAAGGGSGGSKSSDHWGFFTWLIIIIFLCVAAYLIFGSWLNYNRYGARGWDLVPHGDTIRDLPYIAKDIGRRVVNSFQGGDSRGGYSAV